MNNENLKTSIEDVIKANGNQEITGDLMQDALIAIINQFGSGSVFGGFAVPSTIPVSTDVNMFYMAKTPGTYVNFGGYVLESGKIAVFNNKTGVWTADNFVDVNSIEDIEKTSTVGLVDTYTITMTDGSTFDFEVTNGDNAKIPIWSAKDWGANDQVIKDNLIYISSNGSTATDIPGESDKWVNIGDYYFKKSNQDFFLKKNNVTYTVNSGIVDNLGNITGDSTSKYTFFEVIGNKYIGFKGYKAVASNPNSYPTILAMSPNSVVAVLKESVRFDLPQFVDDFIVEIPENCTYVYVVWSNYGIAAGKNPEISLYSVDFNQDLDNAVFDRVKKLENILTGFKSPDKENELFGNFNFGNNILGVSPINEILLSTNLTDPYNSSSVEFNTWLNIPLIINENKRISKIDLSFYRAEGNPNNEYHATTLLGINEKGITELIKPVNTSDNLESFTIDVSMFTHISLYQWNVKATNVQKNAFNVKFYSETVTNTVLDKIEENRDFYLEDYGAVALNPDNPDDGVDCTAAFYACIDAMFKSVSRKATLRLKGMYRIDGDLIDVPSINVPHRAQLILPQIRFSTDMKIFNLSIIGENIPIWEEQGIIEMPVSYNACGFYSSKFNQNADKYNAVMSFNTGFEGSTFGSFNNINIFVDNLMIICRSHDNDGNYVQNTMSGLIAADNSNFTFGKIFTRSSVPGKLSIEPIEQSVGVYLPRNDNHATIVGDYIRSCGFGIGLYATEHCQMNLFVGACNIDGLRVQSTYPVTINTITLESNKYPVRMMANSFLQTWVFQAERVLDNSHWYASGIDFKQNSGTSQVIVGTYIVHMEGGAKVKGNWESGISMRIIQDEFGQSYFPANVWDSLPTNPVEGLEGYFQGQKKVYLGGNWKTISVN